MAVDHRLAPVRRYARRSALFAAAAVLAAACTDRPAPAPAAVPQAIPIMVNLEVGLPRGAALPEPEAIAGVREPFLARLKPLMTDKAFAGIRTFPALPAVAMTADAALIAQLLTWPEVKSIAPNRILQRQGTLR